MYSKEELEAKIRFFWSMFYGGLLAYWTLC